MKFMYPGFLWALLLIAIPVIIHLFNFKRYKTLYFSSLNFVKHVDQQTKSTQRLKHILVLLSRIFAFIFLILAFAQPYFDSGATEAKNSKGITAIYIDNSFSMQSRGSDGELLSEARVKTKELINEAPRNSLFLIGTNEMSGREERLLNKMEALEKMDNIKYSPLSKSIDEVIDWQNEVIKKLTSSEEEQAIPHYLFSDFQKSTSLAKADNDIKVKGRFYPVQLIPEEKANVFIDSIWFTNQNHQVNVANELNFRVRNTSKVDLENVELEIDINEFHKTVFVDVPNSGSKESTITYTDKTTGSKRGKIKCIDKHVFFDDEFFFSYDVEKTTNILILNGEDQIPELPLVYSLDSYFKVESLDIKSITKDKFTSKDLIVLNGVNSIPSGLKTSLIEFAQTGGSVSLFPGTDPNSAEWNSLLSNRKLPLLGSVISSGTRIKSINYHDVFYSGMFEKESQNLNLPAVAKVFQSNRNNSTANDLIALQNGLPLLSYSDYQGNCFMFYSSLSPSFGGFSNDALFPAVLLRIGSISKRRSPAFTTIGNESQHPIYKSVDNSKPVHVSNLDYDFIPETIETAGVTYITLNRLDNVSTLMAGNFNINQEKQLGLISLNYNRTESQLEALTQKEVEDLFNVADGSTVQYNQISSSAKFAGIDIDKPYNYWKICIVLTLIFVLIEMMLVRFLK